MSGAAEPEPVKWSRDIVTNGDERIEVCVGRVSVRGGLCDGKYVKVERWEIGVDYGLEWVVAGTWSDSRNRKEFHGSGYDERCKYDQKTSQDNGNLDDMNYNLEIHKE